MSTRRPPRPPARAPLPRGVYRRRRIMVGLTAVLLVVATVDLVDGDDAAPRPDTARQVAGTPQAAPSGEVVVGPRPGGTQGKKGRKGRNGRKGARSGQAPSVPTSTPAPPPAEPDGPCEDADIVMTPVMGPVVAGRPVLVTLELRTREAEACTWTVSSSSLAYKITADGDDVWSSSHCPRQVPDDVVVVRRDLTTTYRLAWSGRRSSRDCPVSMGYAAPGDYAVQAAAIGGEPSAVVPFTLTDPADVEPEGPVGPPVPEATGGKKAGKKNRKKADRTATSGR